MGKRIADNEVCAEHHRARTICVAGTWYCPDCIDEDLAQRQEDARAAALAAEGVG